MALLPLAGYGTEACRQARRRLNGWRTAVGPCAATRHYLREHPDDSRLNVGCGGALLEGWLNADRDPAPGAIALDASRRFRLPDAAFDRVLVEHVIEHLPLEDGRHMLTECARVLRPGARIRVSTPDLTRLAQLCCGDLDVAAHRYATWAAESFTPGAAGSIPARVLNNAMRAWGHRFLYDEATLELALHDAGFDVVARQPYGESNDAAFDGAEGAGIDETGMVMRRWETLALEAVRA